MLGIGGWWEPDSQVSLLGRRVRQCFVVLTGQQNALRQYSASWVGGPGVVEKCWRNELRGQASWVLTNGGSKSDNGAMFIGLRPVFGLSKVSFKLVSAMVECTCNLLINYISGVERLHQLLCFVRYFNPCNTSTNSSFLPSHRWPPLKLDNVFNWLFV